MFLYIIIAACFFAGVALAFYALTGSSVDQVPDGLKKIPGPKGLPFIGSVHELKSRNPWMSFHEWGQQYGTIYQVNLAGSNHIWIGDEKIAHELLSRKAAIYSDRPNIPALLFNNRTSGQYLPLMSNDHSWHRQRRFAKAMMSVCQSHSFFGYPELEAKRMMMEIMENPDKYNVHLESFVSRVTSRLAWGTSEASDELKQRARELLITVSPTGSLANKLPFLMKLPDWLSPPKAWERRRTNTEKAFFKSMQDDVKADLDQAKASLSWMRIFYELKSSWGFASDMEGAYAVGMSGIAGALTIAAPMQGFCLAMCLHPQFLPKLQREIDDVCGDRPPTYADMPRMPYLRACIRESMRWRPAVPTGIPHMVVQDDVYDGYFIPKNSVIHPLEWSMSRNPTKYPDPDAYNPDRWVDPSYPSFQLPLSRYPSIVGYSQFGYGRRVCQGQEVAEVDLFVGIGSIAWAFNIAKAHDPATGLEIPIPEMEYTELLIAKPKPFKFAMTPRSEKRRQQILDMFDEENARGSFKPSKQYWDPKQPQLGWCKV